MSNHGYACLNCGAVMYGSSVACNCQTPVQAMRGDWTIKKINQMRGTPPPQKSSEEAWKEHYLLQEQYINELEARIKQLESFANRFLSPDDLGYSVNACMRDAAREALGMEKVETKRKEDKL